MIKCCLIYWSDFSEDITFCYLNSLGKLSMVCSQSPAPVLAKHWLNWYINKCRIIKAHWNDYIWLIVSNEISIQTKTLYSSRLYDFNFSIDKHSLKQMLFFKNKSTKNTGVNIKCNNSKTYNFSIEYVTWKLNIFLTKVR